SVVRHADRILLAARAAGRPAVRAVSGGPAYASFSLGAVLGLLARRYSLGRGACDSRRDGADRRVIHAAAVARSLALGGPGNRVCLLRCQLVDTPIHRPCVLPP